MSTSLIERRVVPMSGVELRTSEDGTSVVFRGRAAVYGVEAHGERIAPGAFRKTVNDGGDVRFLVNHEGVPLARTKSGTMTLNAEDPEALLVEATFDRANPTVQELESAMRRGDLDQMSFSMGEIKDSHEDGVRTIKEVRLYDVSAVTFPWYETTSAEVRAEAVALVTRYAEDLGVTIPEWPETRVAEEETDTTADEPVEPSTPEEASRDDGELGEPEHSLPLDVAARRVALSKHRAALNGTA